MPQNVHNDGSILDSWHANAAAWTTAVRSRAIASRRLVTDQAILDALRNRAPARVLDVGCGEGWLARALQASSVEVVGIDAVPELVRLATQAGGGEVRLCQYEELASAGLTGRFDVVVANFSLLGRESVESVFRAVPGLLATGGALVIQTLHPVSASRDEAYEDGWRPGSWAGFGPEFVHPPPWYFRTIGSWLRLLVEFQFQLVDLQEPVDPQTRQPVSMILCAIR